MIPAPGERLLRFVGDRVRFEIGGSASSEGWRARLRTNIGRADVLRREIIQAHAKGARFAGASWRDLPMDEDNDGWSLELSLTESGYFKAKPYLLDPKSWQHWPAGPDIGISVHPNAYRTANTLYCAFPRMFGMSKSALSTRNERIEDQIRQIEEHGYTIIPPSGKLRDLIPCLPHIIETLGCRILHLLPVNPTPTTYARFGRFGSPYAALDLKGIDPALIVFDKRTTGMDQFRELTYATHLRGGRVFLDIVINHTGWGSMLQERTPKWFLREPDGTFVSPGAWGTTWEDLVELKHDNVALWDKLADVFLTWCRRGVDGFRCDAGYKVPVAAWQYIIARVRQEFPETIFLLEGLGGAWETTEALLTEGEMQWAYSELFQNYSAIQVSSYLDHSLNQSRRVGLLAHYSETHDNDRLATRGRAWSLLRNRLCGLASVSGGFGFTCGVEWLATEKIRVHGSAGLAWENRDNIVPELARLNRLLAHHPCFFDGAKLTRLSPPDSPVYALLRESAEGKDVVLVLVNTDVENANTLTLTSDFMPTAADFKFELLGQELPELNSSAEDVQFVLAPGSAYCLSQSAEPRGLSGDAYRNARAQSAWAIQMLSERFSVRDIGPCDWSVLARVVEHSPADFLAAISRVDPEYLRKDLLAAIDSALNQAGFPQIVRWNPSDRYRITPVPPDHWVLIEDTARFRASLRADDDAWIKNFESIQILGGHIASYPPRFDAGDAILQLERYAEADSQVEATIRFLPKDSDSPTPEPRLPKPNDIVLLTNGIGGMARMCVEPGRVNSKYDCVLGANLHPSLPVDRHVFAKRIRVWVNADGFISPLDFQNLASFSAGPPAIWRFVANAGDGRSVGIQMTAEMVQGHNTTIFRFNLLNAFHGSGKTLPDDVDVRLTARVDIEDRNFHSETRHDGGADFHFSVHTHEIQQSKRAPRVVGFFFKPAADRQLRVFANSGEYHPQPEWSENIPHPVEQSRGQVGFGDAYSPGWFELPLAKDAGITLLVTTESAESGWTETTDFKLQPDEDGNSFSARLARAARAFVVRRGEGNTVIAGYPWFLDWGRDTLICVRGLLAAGMIDEVKQILITFARFEQDGMLPNTINGDNTSNRDTSDAPLWFGLVCEEAAETIGRAFYDSVVGPKDRTIRDVLHSIVTNYIKGTPNNIHMDEPSALIWSPAHFTWMDTNHPAGSPREGYPIEIQALWIRLLRQLANVGSHETQKYLVELADRALASLEKYFWLESHGWYADVLLAESGQPAAEAAASDALRSNCIFPISLGLIAGEHARRCIGAVLRYLVIPGGLRSLAPLPISVPLPIQASDGRLLNDPNKPYWPRYEGDEDTSRKPAYHNGTAWTWTFPNFCEALARAWDFSPEAIAAARSYLASMERLVNEGCLGQIPEILDGDAPHTARGCDAQAWGVTEALRVWKLLSAENRSVTAGS